MSKAHKVTADNYLEVTDEVLSIYLAQHPLVGEGWAPAYRKYRDLFNKLTRAEARASREIAKLFKEFSREAASFVNWNKVKTAAEDLVVEKENLIWIRFSHGLLAIFVTNMGQALEAGGQYTERELRVDVGWSEKGHPAINWLRKYGAELVSKVNDTTRKNIRSAIRISIDLGETREQVEERVRKIINNPVRAEMIAQTETVKAYTQGRLEVARGLGFETEKVWEAIMDNRTSQTCINLNGKVLPLDEAFPGGYDGPPAHPRCRSSLHIRPRK
jgi:SPP1 gp7 family putative phage head morphogenesis protein